MPSGKAEKKGKAKSPPLQTPGDVRQQTGTGTIAVTDRLSLSRRMIVSQALRNRGHCPGLFKSSTAKIVTESSQLGMGSEKGDRSRKEICIQYLIQLEFG
jgi:hypothetical protein